MKKQEYYIAGKDGIKIYGYAIVPEKKMKGYVQFVHDLYDTIERYEPIMEFMAAKGYLCFGCDMVGHGKSCENTLGDMKNYVIKDLIEDLYHSYQYVLKKYIPVLDPIFVKEENGKTLQLVRPQLHCMVGVGFGCSLIRSYCVSYKDVNSLIFIGDMAFSSRYSKLLTKAMKQNRRMGDMALAEDIREELQRKWNNNFNDSKIYRNSYRVSDISKIREINKNTLCNFEYTLKSMCLILGVLSELSMSQWLNIMPKYMPLYELSGYSDPVNNYTRELDVMLTKYRYSSLKNVFYKYYEGCRHELFFEKKNKVVISDILRFIDNIYNEMNNVYESQKSMIEKEREDD